MMLFHRYFSIAWVPAVILLAVVLWRLVRSRAGEPEPAVFPAVLAFGSASLCSTAATILRLFGYAHAVSRDSPTKVLTAWVRWLGETALRAHVYSWQHGARIGLTLTGLALAVVAVRSKPRWTGVVALVWALASVAELPTNF